MSGRIIWTRAAGALLMTFVAGCNMPEHNGESVGAGWLEKTCDHGRAIYNDPAHGGVAVVDKAPECATPEK